MGGNPEGPANLDKFLRLGPRSPDPGRLQFNGFVHQYALVDLDSGAEAIVVLASEPAAGLGSEPAFVLDVTAGIALTTEPSDWSAISTQVTVLHELKNRIFERTLTDECLRSNRNA